MNLREYIYTSGAGLTVGHVVQRRTGQRVAILDPNRRTKAVIVSMLLRGVPPRTVAQSLGLPFATVCALGVAGLRLRKKLGRLG